MTEPTIFRSEPRGIPGKYVVLVIVLVAAGTAFWAVKVGRHYVIPKRFHEVEAGHLYRSGYLEPMPLKNVIDGRHIKTILCLLNDEPDNPDQKKELAVVREKGVRLERVPMPGDGKGDFAALDKAADTIADRNNWPILVHCAGGEKRTGAAYAAYRMKHCGWSFEQTIAEGDRYNLSIRNDTDLVNHLRAYHEHLASTSRPASQVSSIGPAEASPSSTSTAAR